MGTGPVSDSWGFNQASFCGFICLLDKGGHTRSFQVLHSPDVRRACDPQGA